MASTGRAYEAAMRVMHGLGAGRLQPHLANVFRKAFDLFATPVAMEFRTDSNPYAARKQPERLRRLGGRPRKAAPRRGPKKR